MTKKKHADNQFLKFEIDRALWERFERALAAVGMTRKKAMIMREFIAEFCDVSEARAKKRETEAP